MPPPGKPLNARTNILNPSHSLSVDTKRKVTDAADFLSTAA